MNHTYTFINMICSPAIRGKCQHKMETVFPHLWPVFYYRGLGNQPTSITYFCINWYQTAKFKCRNTCKRKPSFLVQKSTFILFIHILLRLSTIPNCQGKQGYDCITLNFYMRPTSIFPIWCTEHAYQRATFYLLRKNCHELDFSIIEHRKLFPLFWFTLWTWIYKENFHSFFYTKILLSVVCTVTGRSKVRPFLCRMFAYFILTVIPNCYQ